MRRSAWRVIVLVVLAALAHSLRAAAWDDGIAPSTQGAESVPAWRAARRVAILPIRGEIDAVTLASLTRRLSEAESSGADLVVLELDTPGGDLKSTLDICASIRATPLRVVAWVHPQAFSAGAIIALATDAIVVAPAGVFGDAAPITALPGVGLQPLPDTERAKIEAPLLSEVVESARRVGRDERLVQRFVRLGEPLWLVEDTSSGGRTIVDERELSQLGLHADDPSSGALEGPPPSAWFQTFGSAPLRGEPRPSITAPAADATWHVVARVAEPGTLLTVREREAVALGLAEGTVASDAELSQWTGGGAIERLDERWSEGMVRWITSWPVRLVLVAALLICFVGELLTPGVGAFGAGALACLAVLVGAPALVGLSEWWAATMVLVGLGLVAFELLLVPGTTWVGLGGAVCFGLGMIGVFTGGDLSSPQGRAQLPGAAAVVLGGIALAALGLWVLRRTLSSSSLVQHGVLTAVADGAMDGAPRATPHTRALSLGEEGIAETTLRPAGQARFGERVADVVAVGALVTAGTSVRIVRIDGITTEVEPTGHSPR